MDFAMDDHKAYGAFSWNLGPTFYGALKLFS